jgi:hypothetical protein
LNPPIMGWQAATASGPPTDDITASQLAADPSTPRVELERLVGRSVELDHVIARHPNLSLKTFRALATQYPESVLANPSMARLIYEAPSLVNEMPKLLEQPSCPPSHLMEAARHGGKGKQLAALRNPAISHGLRAMLTPEHFFDDARIQLDAFAQREPMLVRRRFIQAYARMSRTYCLPRYRPLDRTNAADRLADQVGAGFFFTSTAWPWPMYWGHPMQPVAQINLERAGKLLGEDLGSGLAQCWAVPRSSYTREFETIVRHLPKAALFDAPDMTWPLPATWWELENEEARRGCGAGIEPWWAGRRLDWIPMGRMFPEPLHAMTGEWAPMKLGFGDWYEAEVFARNIRRTGIPADINKYFGQVESVRLGGFADGSDFFEHGAQWAGWDELLEAAPLSFGATLVLGGRIVIGGRLVAP